MKKALLAAARPFRLAGRALVPAGRALRPLARPLRPVVRLLRPAVRLLAVAPVLAAYGSRIGAVLLGFAGAGIAMQGGFWLWLPVGLAVHVTAAFLSVAAAARRRGSPLPAAERDAVLWLALFVPGIGPAFAWTMPDRQAGRTVANAHEVLVQYEEHVKPKVPEYERSLFTGNFDRDLARKLDTESYREVLRHGETDQKRSALFRLAELGEPHHLALIRGCLEDDDQEVRLYAYGELDRLVRGFEDRVRAARERVKEDPADPEAHLALGDAHFGLAESGVLDPVTARFHLRGAVRSATDARELSPEGSAPALLLARVHARLGEMEEAAAALDSLPEPIREQAEVCMTRAEVAFLARDFHRAREEAGRLILAGAELPGWLMALCVADDTEPPEDEEDDDGTGAPDADPDADLADGPAPEGAADAEAESEGAVADGEDEPAGAEEPAAAGAEAAEAEAVEAEAAGAEAEGAEAEGAEAQAAGAVAGPEPADGEERR